MERATKNKTEISQRRSLRKVLRDIENKLQSFGYDANIVEFRLFGKALAVDDSESENSLSIVLGDLDEFEVVKNTEEELGIKLTRTRRGGPTYNFSDTGVVKVTSPGRLFEEKIDFSEGLKQF